jgi:hypothetical protein
MTDLKCLPNDEAADDDVTYVWRSQKRQKSDKRKARGTVPVPDSKKEDPMFIPWGDIVESPKRLLKRLFDLC